MKNSNGVMIFDGYRAIGSGNLSALQGPISNQFLFRDAKQFTGLLDCQARCPSALHFHFNASMAALNLLKLEDRQRTEGADRSVISIASREDSQIQ
ncbi:MAG: hypothetical protein IPL59_08375 [Candidatus Competibacteraceae bacterium]|nr:hypothetical protein [Candidatus Competibacteraceae bacterium]